MASGDDVVEGVAVAQFALDQEALIVCHLLEAEGFSPAVDGMLLFGVGNFALRPDDAFKITVPAVEAADARKLLAEIEHGYRPEVPESARQEESAMPCPACGGRGKAYEARSAYHQYARSFWRSFGWLKAYTWRCVDCGHRW